MKEIILIIAALGGPPHEYVVDGTEFTNPIIRCNHIASAAIAQGGAFGNISARCEAREFNVAIAAL